MHVAVGRWAALGLLGSLLLGLVAPARGQNPAAPPASLPPGRAELFQAPPPPLQPLPDEEGPSPVVVGDSIALNGAALDAPWRLEGEPGARQRLVLPIDVLIHQLGIEVDPGADGLRLTWFGHAFPVEEARPPLGDEPAVDVAPLARRFRWRFSSADDRLNLQVPPPRLINVRLGHVGDERLRIVLDFLGPAPIRRQDGELLVEMRSRDEHLREMENLGIPHQWTPGLLRLNTAALSPDSRILTLGRPERLVLDLSHEDFLALRVPGASRDVPAPSQRFQLATRVMSLGGRRFRLHSVALDLANPAVVMTPLTRADGMDELNLLQALAQAGQVDLAINGGYFNRVRKLPLGAIKQHGHWLSGPILGRGAIGWGPGERPIFGRLSMQETVTGPGGAFPLTHLNSGYARKGVARYTHHWGSHYHPLTQGETGFLVQGNRVVRHFAAFQLKNGVALTPGSWLLVARNGAAMPLRLGDPVTLDQRLTPGVFTRQPHVMGAGPLLLLGGHPVLNPALENFSSQFQQQKAPRSLVAWGQGRLWLLTLQGLGNPGPTLQEATQLARQLGMEDALNLDGGSSTTLVVQGVTAVRGRGVNARVHNGLGVVVGQPPDTSSPQSSN